MPLLLQLTARGIGREQATTCCRPPTTFAHPTSSQVSPRGSATAEGSISSFVGARPRSMNSSTLSTHPSDRVPGTFSTASGYAELGTTSPRGLPWPPLGTGSARTPHGASLGYTGSHATAYVAAPPASHATAHTARGSTTNGTSVVEGGGGGGGGGGSRCKAGGPSQGR